MLNQRNNDKFLSVLGDGSIRLVVDAGTEGAVLREYETSDGKKGSKWELVYNSIQGVITGIKFFEGDYGKQLQITIDDKENEPVILSLNTAQPFGEDFMKRLPNVDLNEPVKITPYSIQNENGKFNKGVAISQGENKIKNFFRDTVKKVNLNGYPNPEGDVSSYDKDDWKMYFMKARKFLIKYTEEKIIPKLEVVETKKYEYPEQEGGTAFDEPSELEEDALSKFNSI